MKSPTTSPARHIALIFILLAALLTITGCSDQMAKMEADHLQLQAMVAANARQLATLSSQVDATKGQVNQRLAQVEESAGNINTKVLAVQSQQARLQDAMARSETRLAKELTQVQDNQRLINDGIGQIASISQKTNTAVVAVARDQAVLHELVDANKRELAGQITTVAKNQEQTQAGITSLQQMDREMADRVAAVSQKQDALTRLTTDNHRQVSDRFAVVAQNQQQTHTALSGLQENDAALAAKLTAVSQEQQALQRLATSHHDALNDQLTALSASQARLHNDVGNLQSLTQAVATEQSALRETLKSTGNTVAAKLAIVEQNQLDIQSLIDLVANTANTMNSEVTSLAATQSAMQKRQQSNHEALTNQLTAVTENQQYAKEHLDTITTTAVQLSLDVLTIGEAQASMEQAAQTNHNASTTAMAALAKGHQNLQGNIEKVAAVTDQVVREVSTLGESQDKLERALDNSRNEFATALGSITQDQKTMLGHLDNAATVADNTTRQISALGTKQDAMEQAIEGTRTEFTAALGSVTQGQWAMQGHLDKVSAAAEQVALNVAGIDQNQTELAQIVKANRDELVAKLDGIAQDQQQWLTRFDAAEAKIDAMTAGITALEQRVTKLQGTLQTSLADISSLLDARAEERSQFEETVGQDVQNLTQSVSELANVQANLTENVRQVQDTQHQQTQNILSVLKQLQEKVDSAAVEPTTEFETSKAEPQEVILP